MLRPGLCRSAGGGGVCGGCHEGVGPGVAARRRSNGGLASGRGDLPLPAGAGAVRFTALRRWPEPLGVGGGIEPYLEDSMCTRRASLAGVAGTEPRPVPDLLQHELSGVDVLYWLASGVACVAAPPAQPDACGSQEAPVQRCGRIEREYSQSRRESLDEVHVVLGAAPEVRRHL